MTRLKFYRVKSLPEIGEVGSIYFVSGNEKGVYICVEHQTFEIYGSVDTPITNLDIDPIFLKTNQIITYGDISINLDLIV